MAHFIISQWQYTFYFLSPLRFNLCIHIHIKYIFISKKLKRDEKIQTIVTSTSTWG